MTLPLVFYMLQEFRVPRCMDFIAVYPIDNKFSKYRIGKALGYSRQLQCLVNRGIGHPVGFKTFRYGAVLQAVFVSCPALPCKLNEFAINVFWCASSLLPIQDELGSDRFDKLRGHFRAGQNLLGIETRLPCVIKSRRFFNREGRMLLMLSPMREYVVAKACI